MLPPIPGVEWDKQTLLGFEREMLGLYVSDHPLFGIEHVLSPHADTSIAALMGEDGKPEGSTVTIAGLITGLQVKRTKKGDLWAIVTVEDLEGAIECLFFPERLHDRRARCSSHDTVVVVQGPGQPARRHRVDLRRRTSPCPTSPRARAGRWW